MKPGWWKSLVHCVSDWAVGALLLFFLWFVSMQFHYSCVCSIYFLLHQSFILYHKDIINHILMSWYWLMSVHTAERHLCSVTQLTYVVVVVVANVTRLNIWITESCCDLISKVARRPCSSWVLSVWTQVHRFTVKGPLRISVHTANRWWDDCAFDVQVSSLHMCLLHCVSKLTSGQRILMRGRIAGGFLLGKFSVALNWFCGRWPVRTLVHSMWGNLDVRVIGNGAWRCVGKSRHHPPSKVPLPLERCGPYLIRSSLGPPKSTSKTASRSDQLFLLGSQSLQTDRPCYSVCSSRLDLASAGKGPKK